LLESGSKLIETKIDFWPSLVDALASVLMIVVLATLMQRIASGDIEAAQVREAEYKLKTDLDNRFKAEGLANAVTSTPRPNLLQVRFSDKVLFDPRSSTLHLDGRRVLKICAEALLRTGGAKYDQIQVEGHTDNNEFTDKSYPHDNWELSTARAMAVVKELGRLQVPAKLLSANGYGEQRPIASNATVEGKSRNRRVELRIVFSTPDVK
jgi:chemotaxis protein MotB